MPARAPRIVSVCALALFIIFGVRLSFSVFFAEFVLVEGWSNEAAAAIFSLNMLAFSLAAPVAGLALDRYGPRPVFGFGVSLIAAGLWLSSQAATLREMFFAYGLIAGCGFGITGLGPVASVVAGWTTRAQRGRAVGMAFAGTGLGALVFVPFANFLIAQFGWRGAYLVLAGICLCLLLPLMVFGLSKPPAHPGAGQRGFAPKLATGGLLRDPVFWALMLVGLTALGPVRSLTVHQVAYMQSTGVPRASAANVVGLAGLLTSLAFIGLGWVSDRFSRVTAFSIGGAGLLAAVGALILLRGHDSLLILIAYAGCFALGEGARSSQATALASDVFQRQGLGFINGLMGGMFGLGAAFGPWLVGRLRDASGGYDGGLLAVVMMVIVSLLAYAYAARPRSQPPSVPPTSH